MLLFHHWDLLDKQRCNYRRNKRTELQESKTIFTRPIIADLRLNSLKKQPKITIFYVN